MLSLLRESWFAFFFPIGIDVQTKNIVRERAKRLKRKKNFHFRNADQQRLTIMAMQSKKERERERERERDIVSLWVREKTSSNLVFWTLEINLILWVGWLNQTSRNQTVAFKVGFRLWFLWARLWRQCLQTQLTRPGPIDGSSEKKTLK